MGIKIIKNDVFEIDMICLLEYQTSFVVPFFCFDNEINLLKCNTYNHQNSSHMFIIMSMSLVTRIMLKLWLIECVPLCLTTPVAEMYVYDINLLSMYMTALSWKWCRLWKAYKSYQCRVSLWHNAMSYDLADSRAMTNEEHRADFNLRIKNYPSDDLTHWGRDKMDAIF